MGDMPGIATGSNTQHKRVLQSDLGKLLLAGLPVIVDGTKSRDVRNDPTYILQPGMLLGRVTSANLFAPYVIGKTAAAYAGDATEITVTAATAVELLRRYGATGTGEFKILGAKNNATGTVQAVSVTHSAINTTTGVITVTAIGVAATQTFTMAAGTDGGTFRVKFGEAITAALAFDVAIGALETAVRALHADVAAVDVTTPSGVGVDYLISWPQTGATAGPHALIEIVNDCTADGGVWEGGVDVEHTAVGVDGDFADDSLILAGDVLNPEIVLGDGDGTGLRVVKTSDLATGQNTSVTEALIGGQLKVAQIAQYPTSTFTNLIAWLKVEMRSKGQMFTFDDDFRA